jgi:hypothetical protein
MCRLSGRHSHIFYCCANCWSTRVRTSAGAACLSLRQQLRFTRSGTSNRKAALESWICWLPSCVPTFVWGVLFRDRERRMPDTNRGEVLRSRHAGTATHDVSNARSGEMCGRQAPRGSKVWTPESATLAPDSRRIVAFVSLRHDISCGGSVSRAPRVIVSKD